MSNFSENRRMCLFIHGPNPSPVFDSYRDWIDHMKTKHNPPENYPLRFGDERTRTIDVRTYGDARNIFIEDLPEDHLLPVWMALVEEAERPSIITVSPTDRVATLAICVERVAEGGNI